MKINVLEPKIFNKIAAGEVVERPASIVKELVENSIDAGSKQITIEVENGGISKIRVTDDGCGIDFEDLSKAFLPHATSKIKTDADLFGIKTLGFRGEALASIGAVAFVKLTSKTNEAQSGGQIEISGGTTEEPTVCGAPNGTDIIVQNLFFNIPARAKFLKKPKTEEGEITSLVEKFILANPCVSFKYIVDSKVKYLTTGTGILDAVYSVYGKQSVENMIYCEKNFDDMQIYGYISKPNFTKPNKTYQTTILNGRVIQNSTIFSAINNAYGDVLMKKQFPCCVLYIDIDHDKVDVNVHPNKNDVRFENGGHIYSSIFEAVNRAINSIDYTRDFKTADSNSISLPEFEKEVVIDDSSATISTGIIEQPSMAFDVKPAESKPTLASTSSADNEQQTHNIFSSVLFNTSHGSAKSGVTLVSKLFNEFGKPEQATPQENIGEVSIEQVSFSGQVAEPQARVVGVLFKTYIIIEYDDNILLIDQHAGHERVLFDSLNKQICSNNITTQPLLFPQIIDLNNEEFDFIFEHLKEIKEIGFDIEEFGDNSFKISAVPYIIENIDIKQFFNYILHDLKNPKNITLKETLKDQLASMACKAAVKGGDELSDGEIKKLIQAFSENDTKLLCPHGRPVVIKISKQEIEKLFKRIV